MIKHRIFKDDENFVIELRRVNSPSSYYWFIQKPEKDSYGSAFAPDKLFIKEEIWNDMKQRACLLPLMYDRLNDIIFI